MWETLDEQLGRYSGRGKGESIKKLSDKMISLKRTGTGDDVAELVNFLASDDAEYMTGQNILIDGGIIFT